MSTPPQFDETFLDQFESLVRWRRDVRRFRRDPAPKSLLAAALDLAQLSPSVGNSQPWRIVSVGSAGKREAVRRNFLDCNAEALAQQAPDRAADYARLKLAGLDAAPVQLAIFCDRATRQGHGLGSRTMPEALDYSVVTMISILWFAARARGLGVGWVSILDPARLARDLGVPAAHKFIAYLCIGWPEEEHVDPELVRAGWQERTDIGRFIQHV
jgi:5,6-dimethylbenzimidazole synthase